MLYIPASGKNLFQGIKEKRVAYEEKHGKGSALVISVGEPDGIPPEALREHVSQAALSVVNQVHNYWDNGSPDEYNNRFIQHHTNIDVSEYPHLDTLAIPGIKPILHNLIAACGSGKEIEGISNTGFVHTTPAYDIIGYWADKMGASSAAWPLYSSDDFKLRVANLSKNIHEKMPRMIITVKPGNPTPVGATREEWVEVIEFCIKNNIRLVNDGAYSGLIHDVHTPLIHVAKDYPELEWMELFSVSKTFNACGWRAGSVVGSKDFMADLKSIKGNDDSGANGPTLVGLNNFLSDADAAKEESGKIQKLYKQRLDILRPVLLDVGLQPAGNTNAGFFSLWKAPSSVNGTKISTGAEFNDFMIDNFGIIGVPFVGSEVDGKKEQFIRYAVCAPIENKEFRKNLEERFSKVQVLY